MNDRKGPLTLRVSVNADTPDQFGAGALEIITEASVEMLKLTCSVTDLKETEETIT